MKAYLKNERGNAFIFLLWFIFICGFVMILSMNIMKVFAVKEQANSSAEQASFAATDVVIDEVKKGIQEYDQSPEGILEAVASGETVNKAVDDRKTQLMNSGKSEPEAYVKALNDVLSLKLSSNSELQNEIESSLTDALDKIDNAVVAMIEKNGGDPNDYEIKYLNSDNRIEVTSAATVKTSGFKTFLNPVEDNVKQRGYGPSLSFIDKTDWTDTTLEDFSTEGEWQ